MMRLLAELCDAYEEHYTTEQLWLDPNKVDVLDEAHDELSGTGVEVPASVRDLYARVFHKPMWGVHDPKLNRDATC